MFADYSVQGLDPNCRQNLGCQNVVSREDAIFGLLKLAHETEPKVQLNNDGGPFVFAFSNDRIYQVHIWNGGY